MTRGVRKSISAKIKDEEAFSRADCNERDYNDTGARKTRKGKAKEAEQQRKLISTDFLPSSMKKLRACIHCKLVLNRQRWIDLGKCPNCPSSGGLCDTTEDFHNIIGQIYPKMSWVAQYQGLKDFIPGVYAISVNQTLSARAAEDALNDEYESDY